MSALPTISILVLCYNHAEFLEKNLESFSNQTDKDFELVLIDNNSTDDSFLIMDDFTRRHQEMNIILHKNDVSTVCEGRKAGYVLSSGRYVAFHDGDDWVDDFFVEKYIRTLKENSWPDAVIGVTRSIGQDGTVMSEGGFSALPMSWSKVTLQAYLVRREIIEHNLHRFYNTYFEDFYFTCCFNGDVKTVAVLQEPLYNYCANENSASGARKKSIPGFFVKPFEDLCDSLQRLVIPETAPENLAELEYAIIRQYYSLVYQGSDLLQYRDMRKTYYELNAIMKTDFPNYLKNGINSLFKKNSAPDTFRKRIWISVCLEKVDCAFHSHFLMDGMLLLYWTMLSLALYKRKH